MKNILLLSLCIILSACGASDNITRSATKKINGRWLLKNVYYKTNAKGTFNIKILDEIPLKCLETTQWEFIANNHTGNYELSNNTCTEKGIKNFIWSIPTEMYGLDYSIMLKPVNEKMKSTTNNKGYRMQLSELDINTMVWTYDMDIDGENHFLKLYFIK